MPIYEYFCRQCNLKYEKIILKQNDVPPCPKCGKYENLTKLDSVPSPFQWGD